MSKRAPSRNARQKIRLGVIGAGAVVREIYQHLYFHSHHSQILDVVAVADPSEESRQWFAKLARIPPAMQFADYRKMLREADLDAVQVNTPDHLHRAPTLDALRAGLDVVVPKPTAATLKDTHAMIEAARRSGRFLGVDFHKRDDPRIKEAEARFRSGRYGEFQGAIFYMLDKLSVADPNHAPRFFASPDYAEKNTPVSFLTVHMADALMKIIGLAPVRVTCVGHSHKLPALRPIPVAGFDLVDTEVLFENGGVAHILTGWALPNTAWSTTVQSARVICSEGMFDLGLDTPGLRELHPDAMAEINPLFRNFERDGTVTGYGISNPGKLYRQILDMRSGKISDAERAEILDPITLGFYTTLVLEAGERSLAGGKRMGSGTTIGAPVDLKKLVTEELGPTAARRYRLV